MTKMKMISPSSWNRLLLVIAFILSLVSFSTISSSAAAKKSESVKTELVVARKAPSKRYASFKSVRTRDTRDTFHESILAIDKISNLHTQKVEVALTNNNHLASLYQIRSCRHLMILYSSTEDPFLILIILGAVSAL